jgi:hypothetical protein
MVHAATERLQTPLTLSALTVEGHELSGLFIGDHVSAWNEAVKLSAQRHIRWCEKPNVRITLASKIPAEDCIRLNLGYLDPAKINVDEWKDRKDEGILYVPKAGEILYRLRR